MINSPNDIDAEYHEYTVFLSGSLSINDTSIYWRRKLIACLGPMDCDVAFLNPHRDDLIEDPSCQYYMEHVEWVMKCLNTADQLVFYFDPKVETTVSMMELAAIASNRNVIICCPDKFWKSTIVNVICNEFDVPIFKTIEETAAFLKKRILVDVES